MLTGHRRVHQNDIVTQCTPDRRLAAREQVYQSLLRQPASWILILKICCSIGGRPHSHDPQHTVMLIHATFLPEHKQRCYLSLARRLPASSLEYSSLNRKWLAFYLFFSSKTTSITPSP